MMKLPSTPDRPSDRMFTPLSACDAVQRTFGILFDYLCTFVTLGFLFVPFTIVVVAIVIVTADDNAANSTNGSSTSSNQTDQIPPVGAIIAVVIVGILCVPIILMSQAAMIRATAEVYAGERPQLGEVLKVGARHICRLFCFGFIVLIPLFALLLVGAVVVGIVLGTQQSNNDVVKSIGIVLAVALFPVWFVVYFYVMIPFQMAPPSLVLERTTVTDVVARAWDLSSGRRGDILLATFLLCLINFFVGLIPLVNLFWHLLALPLSSILATVLFINLRVEKEGLTRSGLRGELGMDLLDETELTTEKYMNEKLDLV